MGRARRMSGRKRSNSSGMTIACTSSRTRKPRSRPDGGFSAQRSERSDSTCSCTARLISSGSFVAQAIGAVDELLEPVPQLGLLADLPPRAADRVHVERLLADPVQLQVGEPLVARPPPELGIALAVLEELVDALARQVDELTEMPLARDVEVAQVEELRRQRLAVEVGGLLEQHEAREVDAVESRRSRSPSRSRPRRPSTRAVASGSRPCRWGRWRRASVRPGAASGRAQSGLVSAKCRIMVRPQKTSPR